MILLAISGSLKASSVNTAVLLAVENLTPADTHFHWCNGIGGLPHFNPDEDREGMQPHAAVAAWRNQLEKANAVIVCTPEYALGVPGSLKNALDWIVSSGGFVGKPVSIISASPMDSGGDKAHASLVLTLGMMGAKIIDDASLTIPFIKTKMDAKGTVTDPHLLSLLNRALLALIRSV